MCLHSIVMIYIEVAACQWEDLEAQIWKPMVLSAV